MAIDRFEGDEKQIAVLVADDGTQAIVPEGPLTEGSKAGDILSLGVEKDAASTMQVASETREVRDDLKKSDTGGDIKL